MFYYVFMKSCVLLCAELHNFKLILPENLLNVNYSVKENFKERLD